MGQVTGGVVKYERRVKTGDFEHKHAAAEISFSVPEGENDTKIIDQAGALAHGQVHRLLGTISGGTDGKTDKDRLAEAAGAPAEGKKTRAAKPPATPPAADPGAMDVAQEQPAKTEPAKPEPAAADPGDLSDVLSSAPAEVSDADLTAKIGRVNAATKNPTAIRVLIGKYTPQDGNKHQAAEIPQDKRQAFLAELDTVPKAG